MLHTIDDSLAKLEIEYARIQKLNMDTPVYLRGAERGVEERQSELSTKKAAVLGSVPCLAEIYNATH